MTLRAASPARTSIPSDRLRWLLLVSQALIGSALSIVWVQAFAPMHWIVVLSVPLVMCWWFAFEYRGRARWLSYERDFFHAWLFGD